MLSSTNNYLEKYQQIYPENVEWNTIEYKLQLNLGNASVELKRVYSVFNPMMNTQFEKENKGFVTSEVYINPADLTGSNRIQRVCQKGFEFNTPGQNGMIFTMGQIDNIHPGQKSEYELLVVKICPRRTFPVQANQETLSEDYRIPEGFDSLYFKESEEDKQIFRHRFRINQKMQTLPYYLIQFSFNNAHEQKFRKIMCENCQDVIATHFCLTEKTHFCKKCDYQHHKDKISSKHQRKPLSQKPILNFGFCRNHKQAKNQLFCRSCNESMCISCKIYGSHSEGPMARHELEKISDYFGLIATKINEMDPNLEKRKDQLQELLRVVDKKVEEINKKTVEIQNQLRQMFEQALRDVQLIFRRKLSYLISDQLQIRRQYDYIQWMESFLKYEFNVLPPNSFLASWTKHIKLRKEVLHISNIPAITDIKSNFGIHGKVRVMDQNQMQEQKQRDRSELNRPKVLTLGQQPLEKEKEDVRENQTYFRRRMFGGQEPG